MNSLSQKFEELFGSGAPAIEFFCPGRVNLIGEHIDYLGGLVMPAAISLGITALVRENDSNTIRLFSTDFPKSEELEIKNLLSSKQGKWTDFVLGVLHQFTTNKNIRGLDILFTSDLPKASGLSSSAALEVLSYYIFSKIWEGTEPNRTKMAEVCQQVENNFIGVNCGIMDQFAVANGKANHVMKLDCNSLKFDYSPLDLGNYSLAIINSNKPRELAESAYNQRLEECSQALTEIRKGRQISALVDASLQDLTFLKNETLVKRTRHAITEQQRVLDSVEALKNNDLLQFGALLSASHASLKNDYEVSCSELDFIAESLSKSAFCLGARMTGAGFGGCCIALVESAASTELKNQLTLNYRDQFGVDLSWFNCNISEGVRVVI